MLALRLPPEIAKRLEELAARTGRTKSFHARQAILAHLDELEDAGRAKDPLERGGERVSLEALEKEVRPRGG